MNSVNIDEVESALKYIAVPGSTIEIRALLSDGYDTTLSGYFRDNATAAKHVAKSCGTATGTYVTLNPVRPELHARRADRIDRVGKKGGTTSDVHIVERINILIDFDATPVSGVSSTDAEHAESILTAWQAAGDLVAEGWPEPLIADSGNGAHVVPAISLPADDAGLVERFLGAANARWGHATDGIAVKVDTTNHNPARITKLYGTMARKGDNTADRPHRLSKILYRPETREPVSRELIEAFIVKYGTSKADPQNAKTTGTTNGQMFDVDAWLAKYSIGVRSKFNGSDGRDIWELEVCPFNADHVRGEAHVHRFKSGMLGAGCKHDSCKWGWRELRERFEPDAYTKRTREVPRPNNDHRDEPSRGPDPVHDTPADDLNERRTERWEWAPPLEEFLGDGEPSDDDEEDWIVRDLVPRNESFIFGGAWKSGKTWSAIVLLLCIALGRDFLGFQNTLKRPGRVLLIALEDGKRRLRKRLWQACRGLGVTPNDETIRTHLRVWDTPIRIPADAKAMQRFVAEMQRWKPDVIIIDSLTRAMTGSQNDIRDATNFTAAWRELTIATGASIGFLHHTNKSKSDDRGSKRDPFDNMRGSGELLAAPRNLIVMERLGDDDSKLSSVSMRGNLEIRRSSFALEWQQEERADGRIAVTLRDRGDVEAVRAELAASRKDVKRDEAQRKADRITSVALQTARDRGGCTSSTLAAILSVAERTAKRYLAELRDRGLVGIGNADGAPISDAGLAWLAERGL